jgi:hypothetical protein
MEVMSLARVSSAATNVRPWFSPRGKLKVSGVIGCLDFVVVPNNVKWLYRLYSWRLERDASRRIFWGYVLFIFCVKYECPIILFCFALVTWRRTC